MSVYVHKATDTGRERQINEDFVDVSVLAGGARFLTVCDGMGGHESGEIASATAARALITAVTSGLAQPGASTPTVLQDSFLAAQQAVLTEAQARNTPSMGTTATAVVIEGQRCWAAWIGDSRIYVFRRGHVVARSEDHTRVQEMVRRGILTPAQAKVHPDANVLSRVIGAGGGEAFHPDVWSEAFALESADVVVLCSDGLWDLLDDADIYRTIAGLNYKDAPRALVDAANAKGGHDNISVALAVVGQSSVPALDDPRAPHLDRRGSTTQREQAVESPNIGARSLDAPASRSQAEVPEEETTLRLALDRDPLRPDRRRRPVSAPEPAEQRPPADRRLPEPRAAPAPPRAQRLSAQTWLALGLCAISLGLFALFFYRLWGSR